MEIFNSNPAEPNSNHWQSQLDEFVTANQHALAALTWGLYQQRIDRDMILGIDLKPSPHWITCSREALEQFNQNVDQKLQEILGLIDSFNPETEVLMIGFGGHEIKLIYFEPDPTPPECFVQLGQDIEALLEQLETKIKQQILGNQ
ncbi:MAG: beta-carboxysome assembly chaperone CcmS [Microcoleaceae cyanobacterium]